VKKWLFNERFLKVSSQRLRNQQGEMMLRRKRNQFALICFKSESEMKQTERFGQRENDGKLSKAFRAHRKQLRNWKDRGNDLQGMQNKKKSKTVWFRR
jgi:hypothetical protein